MTLNPNVTAEGAPPAERPNGGRKNLDLPGQYDLARLTLPNRLVMAPMTRTRSNDEGVADHPTVNQQTAA